MAVSVLKARVRIENEIDKAYQIVRRRKPMDALVRGDEVGLVFGRQGEGVGMLKGLGEKRKRRKGDGGVG